jgi:hypothetical protein
LRYRLEGVSQQQQPGVAAIDNRQPVPTDNGKSKR